jgi:predicted ester cyclase
MDVIDVVRFEGDRVAEHWGVSDVAGMMQQVGLGG